MPNYDELKRNFEHLVDVLAETKQEFEEAYNDSLDREERAFAANNAVTNMISVESIITQILGDLQDRATELRD